MLHGVNQQAFGVWYIELSGSNLTHECIFLFQYVNEQVKISMLINGHNRVPSHSHIWWLIDSRLWFGNLQWWVTEGYLFRIYHACHSQKEWEKINFISSSGSHSSIEYRKGFLSACDPEPFKQKGYCWYWSRVHYREVRGDRPYSPEYKCFARIVFGGCAS